MCIRDRLKGQAFDGAFDWGVNYGFTRAVFDEYTDGEGDKMCIRDRICANFPAMFLIL